LFRSDFRRPGVDNAETSAFAIAVVLALWMRNLGYGWSATLGAAVVIWSVLPFVMSQLAAAFVLVRIHTRARPGEWDLADNLFWSAFERRLLRRLNIGHFGA
jgi:hypothetical protein